MLSTIFKYEWKQFSRSKGLIAALIVFCAIGFFCLQQGRAVYHFQQVSVDSAMVKKVRNYKRVKQIFDTLTYTSLQRNNIEEPFVIEWRLQDVVSKNISPLSILSIGQSDIYAPLISGHFNRDIFKNEFAEFQNPEKLLAGNLDVSFFILFLFPLLLLALTYNVQSADKETGITPLLTAQATSVNKIIYQRLLFRWLLALSPIIIIAILSFFQLATLPQFSVPAFLQWWSVALLYTIFWFAVAALVQRFQFSSLINAIVLAGVWVLFLIAIPGLLNTWFNYKYPATNKTEIAEYRDYDYKAWDKPNAEHKKFLFSIYPQLQKDSARLDSNDIRSFSYSLQVFKREKELYTAITNKKEEQALAEEKSFWINPAGGLMRSFAAISNTTLQQQQQFEQSVMAYRLQKLKHIYENQLLQPHFAKKDFEGMPKYTEREKAKDFFSYLSPLILLIGLVAIRLLIKKKN